MRSVRALVALLPLVVLGAACGEDEPDPESARGLSDQRVMLSQGYSMLYTDASHLGLVDLVLYVKLESEEFSQVITAIGAYGGELKRDLERIAKDYPGVRIDLKALPEMETRKRFAIGKRNILRFVPGGGRSRVEFERTMLISMANALNHESHLCQVMAEEETDAGLRKFLLQSGKRYADLRELALGLLDREHFRGGGHASR